MFAILIINCVIIIYATIESDEDTLIILDTIDDVILYFYIKECIIKGIGLGLEKYWEDNWNKFDFFMVLLSLFSNLLYSVLTVLKSAKSAKATKILKITKLNRVFKMFRALRTVKVVNVLMIGADTFHQVKLLIERILICIPLSNIYIYLLYD